MRIDDDFNTMIEWGEEENQPDFVEFLKHFRESYKEKKPVIIEQDGVETEVVMSSPVLSFKKPFPDFDISFIYFKDEKKKKLALFSWDYTYMHMIKKIGDNKFHITAEESPEATIWFK